MHKLKVLFLGSGIFAVPIVEKLMNSDKVDLVAVITQPDRPVGRKQELTPPPVKRLLVDNDFQGKIFQPKSIRNSEIEILEEINPDINIVADYGQILSEYLINFPKYKSLNIHGSLLPKYRGAVPIQKAILDGEITSGISVIVMTPGLDDGPIIFEKEVKIATKETSESLYNKLSKLSAEFIEKVIVDWSEGRLNSKDQDNEAATITYKHDVSKHKAEIFLDDNPEYIERATRAFYPWPNAWIKINYRGSMKRLKLFNVDVANLNSTVAVGYFLKEGKDLYIKLNKGVLKLNEIQLEGMKRAAGQEYLFLVDKDIYVDHENV